MLRALAHSGKPQAARDLGSMAPARKIAVKLKRRPRPAHPRQALHYVVCRTADLKPGESTKFMLPIRGTDEECFAINFDGAFHAYVNRCRHIPMAMDWVENQFFAEQGRYLMCQTHCAYYDPASGECISGPPTACGKVLYRVPLEVRDGVIYAREPEQQFED